MDTQGKGARCPKCAGTNVHIYKRGYSFGLGLVMAVVLTLAFMVWQIVRTDYANLSEAGQTGVVVGMSLQLVWPVIFGLLCGLIGKNQLRGKCLDCGKSFDIK